MALGNATSVDDAVGTQLDTLGSLLDVLRDTASRSRVTATLTGVSGTGVTAGSRAKTTAGAEFRTLAAVVLAPSPGVTVDMEAVETGCGRGRRRHAYGDCNRRVRLGDDYQCQRRRCGQYAAS